MLNLNGLCVELLQCQTTLDEKSHYLRRGQKPVRCSTLHFRNCCGSSNGPSFLECILAKCFAESIG